MSDYQDEHEEPLGDSIDALLSDPATWDDPPAGLEDFLVATITAEAASTGVASSEAPPLASNVVSLFSPKRIAGVVVPFAAGIAAALLLVVALQSQPKPVVGTEVALAGTPLAPGATATALITEGSLGVRIILDVSGLEAAPAGFYYEAWVRQDAAVGVSAGTFHLHGGDGSIELWAGVSTQEYPLVTVTLQAEGAGAESSGQVVLKGLLGSN